jgi:hypothetical protein
MVRPNRGAAGLNRWGVRVSVTLPLCRVVPVHRLFQTLRVRLGEWRDSSTHLVV